MNLCRFHFSMKSGIAEVPAPVFSHCAISSSVASPLKSKASLKARMLCRFEQKARMLLRPISALLRVQFFNRALRPLYNLRQTLRLVVSIAHYSSPWLVGTRLVLARFFGLFFQVPGTQLAYHVVTAVQCEPEWEAASVGSCSTIGSRTGNRQLLASNRQFRNR